MTFCLARNTPISQASSPDRCHHHYPHLPINPAAIWSRFLSSRDKYLHRVASRVSGKHSYWSQRSPSGAYGESEGKARTPLRASMHFGGAGEVSYGVSIAPIGRGRWLAEVGEKGLGSIEQKAKGKRGPRNLLLGIPQLQKVRAVFQVRLSSLFHWVNEGKKRGAGDFLFGSSHYCLRRLFHY